jgi:TfoX/Sxy family transcriptional regulator of competence genes
MAYDEGLAERVQDCFAGRSDVEDKKMFGGLCFMVSNHMCCGIVGDTLMARVGPEKYEECLKKKYAKEMDFTGKAMKGMVYVLPEGIENDADLASWVAICEAFVESLPPKRPKKSKKT